MGYSLGGVYDSDSKERRIESHVQDGCPYLTRGLTSAGYRTLDR